MAFSYMASAEVLIPIAEATSSRDFFSTESQQSACDFFCIHFITSLSIVTFRDHNTSITRKNVNTFRDIFTLTISRIVILLGKEVILWLRLDLLLNNLEKTKG